MAVRGGLVNGSHLLDGTYFISVYPEQCLQVFCGSINVGSWKGSTTSGLQWGVGVNIWHSLLTQGLIKIIFSMGWGAGAVLCEGLCWWDTAALWGHPATAPICSQMWGWWSPFCAALSKAGLQQHLKHHSPWRSEGSCGCFALISFGGLIFAVSLAPTSAAPGLTADGCSAPICRCSREQIINHPAMATGTWGFGLFFNPEKLQVQTCTFC